MVQRAGIVASFTPSSSVVLPLPSVGPTVECASHMRRRPEPSAFHLQFERVTCN